METAKNNNLSISDYLREMGVDSKIIKRELKGINEIRKIGISINQIAKTVSESGFVTESDINKLWAQYEKMFGIIYDPIING